MKIEMRIQLILLIVSSISECLAIWCYQCTAATPGCNEPFNWRGIGYLGSPCVDSEDVCVKLIERKGAQEIITRDCLSNFRPFRTDIPADTYEGCRPAAKDVNLANYVNNSIKELDVKREWYDETIWCMCFLDNRCNSASAVSISFVGLALSIVLLLTKMFP
ncbi:unnamed protein product [Parnassius apollo]|uniref:(apollo) hypothetical protein n=1 Tax=Parnassius apollo TaxID=110799 RepID=A0A8S3YAD2_PARAO|nr:unnamed protein product [Parnassius apollo]